MGSVEEVVEAFEELLAQGRHGKSFNEFARSGRGELFILKYLSRKTAPVLPSELGAALGSSTSRISAALKTL
ncbi:MAG: MarR family transcriptional regulator, partial [Clostridiales bacterium]|nr:MarR family transcriptional regulator [Clostridiales bacterium]